MKENHPPIFVLTKTAKPAIMDVLGQAGESVGLQFNCQFHVISIGTELAYYGEHHSRCSYRTRLFCRFSAPTLSPPPAWVALYPSEPTILLF